MAGYDNPSGFNTSNSASGGGNRSNTNTNSNPFDSF